MKILVIEDEEAVRQTLQDMLELNGFEVIVAANGLEGVKLAAMNPDFIFCDIAMPGLDGFGTIEAIRQTERGRLVPFVFLTAKADRADQRRGMALGADDYITKPFTEKEIVEAIAARTRRQQPLRERVDALVEQQRRQAGADWSHELLTPLNGILGGLQLLELEADTISREEIKEVIELIRGGIERQEKLARKLIRYFELERVRQGLRSMKTVVSPADASVRSGAGLAAAEAKRDSDVDVQCAPGSVPVGASFLSNAVAELVGNALFFSSPGQKVIVTGGPRDSRYVIEVIDQGPGMTAEERANEAPFTQFGRARLGQQGLGLGLAIVRSFAQIAGGTLTLAEGPGGRGLRAILDLPLARS